MYFNPRVISLFTLLLILSSCFVADNIFLDESQEVSSDNLQKKAEEAVKAHIKSDIQNEVTYKPYGFNSIKIIKPIAIVELDRLEEEYKKNPNDTIKKLNYEKQLAHVRKMQIERTVKIDHFYTLQKDSADIQVFEVSYYLNDTFGIKSFEPEISLNINQTEREILDFYFYEYTLFRARTYSEGRTLSLNFYRHFKGRLEEIDDRKTKSAFLRHVLDLCTIVRVTGEFNQDNVVQAITQKYILKNRADIIDYAPLDYTTLYETKNNENDELMGYYFFHKFSGTYNNITDTSVVLVEFSPYYEVNQIFQMEEPFEFYLKQVE